MSAEKSLPESLPLEKRFTYNEAENKFFVNFQDLTINSITDIYRIEFLVAEKLSHLEKKVSAIVNYENFSINEKIVDPYSKMVNRLMEHFYSGVTRYTSSNHLKSSLEKGFKGAHVPPNIFTSSTEAENALKDLG